MFCLMVAGGGDHLLESLGSDDKHEADSRDHGLTLERFLQSVPL